MKLLIIDGTRFVGRGIVGAALQFNQRVYMPGEDPATWRRYFDGCSIYSSKDLVKRYNCRY